MTTPDHMEKLITEMFYVENLLLYLNQQHNLEVV